MSSNIITKTHISFTSCADVKAICKPLFQHLPVRVFEYSRVYPNGARCELCTHPGHLENAFITQKNMTETYTPSLIPNDAKWSIINNWIETIPVSKRSKIVRQLISQRELFGIGNEFVLIKRHNDFVEYFYFYCKADEPGVTNQLLNAMHLLEHFTIYFLNQAHELIQASSKTPLVKPWLNSKMPGKIETILSSTTVIDEHVFIKDTQLKEFYVKNNHIEEKLSERELSCAKYLIKGFSAKEIARILELSPRTVETFIVRLKLKPT